MSSRPASKTPLNIAWSPRSIFRPFLINFGHMWEEKTIKKQWRGLQNQALHALDPTEFHIRFWSDFALISNQLELILKRLDRRQSPLGPALEVQRASLASYRCEEVVGEPGCKSDHPVLKLPGPQKVQISPPK